MNILIADSGSTKTDWCFIRDNKAGEIVQTPGLNPYFINKDSITNILDKELAPYIYFDKVDELYFYGAGLGNPQNKIILDDVFSEVFVNADLTLETDILGAARSLFGNLKGIAAIFGTGSNSCFYNNGIIQKQYPSLGFILGDEGSGSYIGKLLLRSLISSELPPELQTAFYNNFNTESSQILNRIYHQKNANIELSSYVPFVAENLEHPLINAMVTKSFDDFFSHHPALNDEYKNEEWRVTGSIAYVFAGQLLNSAEKFNIKIGKISKSPVEGLIVYHSQGNILQE